MAGEIDEQSQAIGQLQAGLEALRRDHAEKSREDKEFQKAGYQAFEALKSVVETQKDHSKRLDVHDQRASRQRGFIAALTIAWAAVSTGVTWAVSYFTSPQ